MPKTKKPARKAKQEIVIGQVVTKKLVEATYEFTGSVPNSEIEDVRVRVQVSGNKISLVDENGEPKEYCFSMKDSPERRELWLTVLRTLEIAILETPALKKIK